MTIKTENWLGEYTSTIGTGDITLGGAIDGFADFSNVGNDVDVYYTIMDALDKETGIGTLTAGKLVRTTIHATLISGVYVKNGSPINLSGDAQVYGTANAHFLEHVKAISNASEANTQAIEDLLKIQINGHTLSASFNLNASEVGARPDNWTPTANEVGAYSKSESDTRFLNAQDAEQSLGKVMRVGGTRDQDLQQQINDVSTAFICDVPPTGAPVGKRWFDTISGRTFIKYNDGDSTQWVEESPAGAPLMVPSDRPVLCVDFIQLRTKMWNGYLPSDGQILNRADWPDAWAAISAGLVPVCSDADWLANPDKRGCFTLGDGTNTFRMADYNGKSVGSLGSAFLSGDGLNIININDLIKMTAGCFAHKMLGALQTSLPLVSALQLAALEARIAALEAQP